MRNLYLREKPFKGSKNKNYCIQIFVTSISDMFWQTFNCEIVLFDDARYIGLYLNLFGSFLDFKLDWTRRRDHAGFRFIFSLLWFNIDLSTYDSRHWDDDKEQWEIYKK